MSVGLPPSKAELDGTAAAHVRELENLFARVQRYQDWLVATPDATLTAAPYGYSAGEVATLKSAYGDLAALKTTYETNRRAFTKQLMGLGPV